MLTLVICLVVLGGSIAVVLVLSLGGVEQPATDVARPHRERAPRSTPKAPGVTARLGRLARRATAAAPARAAASPGAARVTATATAERSAPRPPSTPAAAPAPAGPAEPPSRRGRAGRERAGSRPVEGPRGVRVITVSPWQRVRAVLGLVAMTALVGLLVAGMVALAALAIALGLREAVG